ncbi:hypothetical protein JXM67_12720 [candidate division WOR-3 bacterium]|nr:hypothetical protein [candidate division WOR-3 bacterium]
MARERLADFLERLGVRLFRFLTRLDDKTVISGLSRFLRYSILGMFVIIISLLIPRPLRAEHTCYVPVLDEFDCDELLQRVLITEISVTPNPTQGADSVTVKAHAEVINSNEYDPFVGAKLRLESDTVDMQAVDSIFDEQEENIIGKISVEGLEPGEYWVYASATTSLGYTAANGIPLLVTEPDSTQVSDTTEKKEE